MPPAPAGRSCYNLRPMPAPKKIEIIARALAVRDGRAFSEGAGPVPRTHAREIQEKV